MELPCCLGCQKRASLSFVVNQTPIGPYCNNCFAAAWKEAGSKASRLLTLEEPPGV